MIPVTKPFLPPIAEYSKHLEQIWKRNWLTNDGPLVKEFELKIKKHLKIKHFLYVSNGTVALQIAIKALALKGEVITTPFSYVATTSSLVWEKCKPIFVDIDEKSFNIDPSKIEASITKHTTAILATHVYGNPCAIDKITNIAKKYNLKVIYDASHCFGTIYKGKSIFEYGDISTTSFHATKLFHTTEGGGLFSLNSDLIKKMAYMRNFGHDGEYKFSEVGINGKNSEFHAAMGLTNLKYANLILEKRKTDSAIYDKWFTHLHLTTTTIDSNTDFNHAYYPIVFNSQEECELVHAMLKENNVFPRRYFYPLLSELNYLNSKVQLPIAEKIATSILCLPLYYQLSKDEIDLVSSLILRTLKN